MHTAAILLSILIAAQSVICVALNVETRGLEARVPGCTTVKTGFLVADKSGVHKALTLNSKNQVSYVGNGKNALKVQFQACANSESDLPTDHDERIGIIYVPSKKKCIRITNQKSTKGPYYTSLATCKEEYAQTFLARPANGWATYFIGDSDIGEDILSQGGCGILGYSSTKSGAPPAGQVTISCAGRPFHIAQSAK